MNLAAMGHSVAAKEAHMPRNAGVKMPGTLKRSPDKAQRTYARTLENAEKEYGSGERASRTAYASLKHGFEKVGDHWQAKSRKGPSDAQAARGGSAARRGKGKTAGGVDERGHSRAELYERARSLGIAGRSRMNKEGLARAIARKQK
jgi:hypothetical protein